MDFATLFEELSKRLPVEKTPSGNEVIHVPDGVLRVRAGEWGCSGGYDTYAGVVAVSRHFVTKPICAVEVKMGSGGSTVLRTTEDHTCMRFLEDKWELERVSARELSAGDLVCVCDPYVYFGREVCDRRVPVLSVTVEPNPDGMWVYDMEVATERHVYFANHVLVHNSQFINLAPVLQKVVARDGKSADTAFSAATETERKEVMDEAYHIVDLANEHVADLVNRTCHTAHGDILHYSLEYIAAEGMYFKKKHYIVRKILCDDLPCDEFKYSGISVKKAEIPASMKDFLKRIYESTMKEEWSEAKYRREVESAFSSFSKMDWKDIAYYRKYVTPKRALSLTESEKGAGVHARAANFYNQLIDKLGIGGKYPKIGRGDEFRYAYVLPTNEYGMDCIAFKGDFPDEFRSLFKPDYETMFDKIFTKSLENYIKIMHYRKADPTRREEDPEFTIF